MAESTSAVTEKDAFENQDKSIPKPLQSIGLPQTGSLWLRFWADKSLLWLRRKQVWHGDKETLTEFFGFLGLLDFSDFDARIKKIDHVIECSSKLVKFTIGYSTIETNPVVMAKLEFEYSSRNFESSFWSFGTLWLLIYGPKSVINCINHFLQVWGFWLASL